MTPIAGVNPASIPGSFARHRSSTAAPDNGTLDYGGGPVLHGSSPYVIFWGPSNEFPTADEALFTRYFADLTADSGKATNVFAVDRQYTDTTGFADYSQTWAPSHLIQDTQAYPTTGNCTENAGFTESTCLYDNQIQAEVTRVVNADGLPRPESPATRRSTSWSRRRTSTAASRLRPASHRSAPTMRSARTTPSTAKAATTCCTRTSRRP